MLLWQKLDIAPQRLCAPKISKNSVEEKTALFKYWQQNTAKSELIGGFLGGNVEIGASAPPQFARISIFFIMLSLDFVCKCTPKWAENRLFWPQIIDVKSI